MTRTVALSSLYEPLAFLETKIRNFKQCDLTDVVVYWSDCSPTRTWNEVEKLIRSECTFEYRLDHHTERQTLYWTWNWMISQTQGIAQYYCNTNVDDLLHPEYFRRMAGLLSDRPGIQIVAPHWYATSALGQLWPPPTVQEVVAVPDPQLTMGHFPMWRASVHEAVGLFNPLMKAIGDAEFWYRVKRRFGPEAMAVLSEVLACYVSHNNNLYYVTDQSGDWAMMPRELRG